MARRNPKLKVSEADLAESVILWLRDAEWDVFQEVQTRCGSRADIVAVKNGCTWIIESKLLFGFDVLQQAHSMRHHANRVSVAVPPMRDRSSFQFRAMIAAKLGIGVLLSVPGCEDLYTGGTRSKVHEDTVPETRADTSVSVGFRDGLTDRHRTYAKAGTSGKYWTVFKETSERVVEFVRLNPRSSMEQIVGGVKHHYASKSSAKSCLRSLVDDGVIKLGIDRSVRPFLYFVEELSNGGCKEEECKEEGRG